MNSFKESLGVCQMDKEGNTSHQCVLPPQSIHRGTTTMGNSQEFSKADSECLDKKCWGLRLERSEVASL